MKLFNKISETDAFQQFNEVNSIHQIKNTKNQLILFDLKEKEKDIDINDYQIVKENEQIIFSIISRNISEKIKYFIDSKDENFNFELYIIILITQIKEKISFILKKVKGIESSLFQKINKNTIKTIQSIVSKFLLSFYDNLGNYDKEKEDIIIKKEIENNNEDNFLISCIKIILILNKYIKKGIIQGIFGQIKTKENKKLISKLSTYLIKIIDIFIQIKKNKEAFNINININNNNGYYNNYFFSDLIERTYDKNMPGLISFLFNIIFKSDLFSFFKIILNKDEISQILINTSRYDNEARYLFLTLLNNAPILNKTDQKELLKILDTNDAILNFFNCISNDIKGKIYNESDKLIKLFEELKVLYIFSLLIHNKKINSEKIIIQIIQKVIDLTKENKINEYFGNFINDLFKLGKKIQKYKYKIYDFIFTIIESIKELRIIASKIFFSRIKENLGEYLEITKNVESFNSFLNKISNYDGEVISIFFEFLKCLYKKEYIPTNEIIQIIGELPFFTNTSSAKSFIQNLENIINLKNDIDLSSFSTSPDKEIEKIDDYSKDYAKFKNKICESYLNILYNIILELKDNINSVKYKSPFDIDVTLSSIINTNFSINEEIEKQYLNIDILIIFIDFLPIILKENKMFQLFISKQFLEFFPYLVNDKEYKIVSYKLIKYYLKSEINNEDNTEKNKQQILIILNRFHTLFYKNEILNEIDKMEEILLMMDSLKLLFSKKLLSSYDDIEKKIVDFYLFYPKYINENHKKLFEIYNNDYHIKIKNYFDIIIELISISNQNIISKNNNYFSINYININSILENFFKFYIHFIKEREERNAFFLDIIKYFIDKSINIYTPEEDSMRNILDNSFSKKDFSSYYISKYKINNDALKDKNESKNINIISNFCIQSPMIILLLLKVLNKYNIFLNEYLEFLYFLFKINQQNISLLLKQNLLKILLKIFQEKPEYNEIISKILTESFKYLDKSDFYYIFCKINKLLNKIEENNQNKNIVKQLFQSIINALKFLTSKNNNFSKGIILSKYEIRQPNIFNLLKIKNLKLGDDLDSIIIKQEIFFFKSLKVKKLILLRISNNKNDNESFIINNNNEYIEISLRGEEIIVSENNERMKYEDLSNYNSIFLNNNDFENKENHLILGEKNLITYIFNINKKRLAIYINGHNIISYVVNFEFKKIINLEIGFPLDLIKNKKNINFKLYSYIKIKSFDIFTKNKNSIENIYKLYIDKISCDYLFSDELTNFKLDENTYLISKYNNINSVILNSFANKNFIKSHFYKNIFFNQNFTSLTLDYLYRLDKMIIILLNNTNIEKIIFNELIQLLCIYLILNKNFIKKYFSKEEFFSSLYFSLYKNVKFIDKNTIENLLSIINNAENNSNINNLIIDILLDIKIFELLNPQIQIDLINSINNNIIKKEKKFINIFYIIEKLKLILILCLSSNKINIDEIIIDIIIEAFEDNKKEEKMKKLIEELIYILFYFDKFSSAHLLKYKKGKLKETSKIINENFKKLYDNETISHLKDYFLKKAEYLSNDIEIKDRISWLIFSYSPSNLINISNNDRNNILNFKEDDTDEDDDLYSLFNIRKSLINKKRSLSFNKLETKNNINNININIKSKIFKGRKLGKKKTYNYNDNFKILEIIKSNKELNKNFSLKLEPIRGQTSIRPFDDVIILKGVINGRKNSYRNKLKHSLKKKLEININIIDKEKLICIGDCYLCQFIQKLLIIMIKREKQFEIYKKYLLHIISEVFIMNQNKKRNLNFDLNFSYYLMKREGPNRIRKKFNIRIDKLLNNEYDRENFKNKEKKIITNGYWKLFDFYENKNKGKYMSENLYNLFNLGQIFKIDIIHEFVDKDDNYLDSFNCLLFKGLSYINSILILGTNKIYIIARTNLSSDNILYDAYFPISKKFWILDDYDDILIDQCEYLNSYENFQNLYKEDIYNKKKQSKKKKFEKNEKGFWIYSFYYLEINEIHKRRFLHQKNAIEIFLKNGKNYYIAFNIDKTNKIIKLIINNIKSSYQTKNNSFIINNNYNSIKDFQNENKKENKINDNFGNIIYEIQNESLIKNDHMIFTMEPELFFEYSKKCKKSNFFKDIFKKSKRSNLYFATILDNNKVLEKCYEHWTYGHISTYAYIMILNTLSGRTYNDLAQFPIYPWILSDYSSKELDFNDDDIYRDLNYPIYAQNEESRLILKQKFESFDEYSQFKYHSGSHYSNAGFVCYYLIRVKPFSITNAEIQGEYFDASDRLFYNVDYFYSINEKYQELIPEMFNIPEIFVNINKFEFGLNSEKKNIDNVIIPNWGKHSPRLFCELFKKSIESQYVSININNWIDLIFGYKQKGIAAEKSYNTFREVCSKFDPKKDYENELELKINEICEMGINPIQLFHKPHHKREKHKKIKAFFSKNIYLQYFKINEKIMKLKNIENNGFIEMRKYYEYPNKYISSGEGGLSSFKIAYEDDNDNNKENKQNNFYFIVTGKKLLIPPSFKNFISWENNNSFYIVKPYKNVKYKFYIKHMRKQIINCINITKDGNFIIIGYNNGILEKYKLIRIWGPKINNIQEKDEKHKSILHTAKTLKEENIEIKNKDIDNKEKEDIDIKEGGLFNKLFKNKNKRKSVIPQIYKRFNINNINKEDDEENKKILCEIDLIFNKNINQNSNKILFDTQIPICSSNIINSDCILLNNNTGKFIEYTGECSSCSFTNEEENKINIKGYDIYFHNENKNNIFTKKENKNNSIEKYYVIFLVNSMNQIFEEISIIEICEPYSLLLIIDKENNLYILDFNTFDLIKKINCNIYFKNKIKFVNICPITGDFILSSKYDIILMSINGVFLTKINNFKSKITYCFIQSIYANDLYLFTAHEDGNIIISKLINNVHGIIFDINNINNINESKDNNLLNSFAINKLNDLYEPIKIKNILETYYTAYDTSNDKSKKLEEQKKYLEDKNNFSLIFDTLIEIKCSENSLKYIKLSQDLSELICIDIKNNLINLNYNDFFLSKKKFKDKKNIIYCNKCKNPISSFKILCQICGKKLCSNCKIETIIPEISLRHQKPICDECFQLYIS